MEPQMPARLSENPPLDEKPPRMGPPKTAAANHPQGDADGLGKLHRSTMAIPRNSIGKTANPSGLTTSLSPAATLDQCKNNQLPVGNAPQLGK